MIYCVFSGHVFVRALPVDGPALRRLVAVLPLAEARGGVPGWARQPPPHRAIQLHLHRKENETISGNLFGDCRTPMSSIRPFYANPKFGNNFGEFLRHSKDVTHMEMGVCRQNYSMNIPLISAEYLNLSCVK